MCVCVAQSTILALQDLNQLLNVLIYLSFAEMPNEFAIILILNEIKRQTEQKLKLTEKRNKTKQESAYFHSKEKQNDENNVEYWISLRLVFPSSNNQLRNNLKQKQMNTTSHRHPHT